MSEVVAQAVLPWRIDRHPLFPRGFVPRLIVLLLVQQRLERQADEFALALQGQAQPLAPYMLRRQRRLVALQLTRELWLAVAPFLPRFGAVGRPGEQYVILWSDVGASHHLEQIPTTFGRNNLGQIPTTFVRNVAHRAHFKVTKFGGWLSEVARDCSHDAALQSHCRKQRG